MNSSSTDSLSCDGDCHSCGAWAQLGALTGSGQLAGWRLAGVAVAVFLLPLALAVLCAALVRDHAGLQAPAGLAGLLAGALAVSRVMRFAVRCKGGKKA